MSNKRWVLNFLKTLNRPYCVSAIQCFLLGTNLGGRTSLRKCWSHCSPQSFQEKIWLILNSCSSTPAFKVTTITKLPTAKMDENIPVPTIPWNFRRCFFWSIRAKRNHPDPLNTNPMNILIIWFTCWEKNVWLVDLPVPESSSRLNLLLPRAVFCFLQCFAFILRPFQE